MAVSKELQDFLQDPSRKTLDFSDLLTQDQKDYAQQLVNIFLRPLLFHFLRNVIS